MSDSEFEHTLMSDSEFEVAAGSADDFRQSRSNPSIPARVAHETKRVGKPRTVDKTQAQRPGCGLVCSLRNLAYRHKCPMVQGYYSKEARHSRRLEKMHVRVATRMQPQNT